MKRYNKNIIKVINGALILVLLSSLTLTLFTLYFRVRDSRLSFGSYSMFRIVTGSMEPTYMVGDFVIVKKTSMAELSDDDIIAFVSEDKEIYGQVVIHRIVSVDQSGTVTTIGDANPTKDYNTVGGKNILGLVKHRVPLFRAIETAVSSAPVFFMVFIAPILFILANEAVLLLNERRQRSVIGAEISARGLDPKDMALCALIEKYGVCILDEIIAKKDKGGIENIEK